MVEVKRSKFDFSSSPFIVIWEVTQACDLACIHCRAEARPWRDPSELSTEEGYRLIDEISRFDSPLLVLTGGDPVKREDIYELVAYSVKKGLRTTVSPSATPLLTKEAIRRFKEAGVSRIAISLDGSCPDIHDSFRKVRGSFRWTMKAMWDCVQEGIPLQINTTVTRNNFKDLINIAFLIKNFGIVLWSVFFLVPTGRGRKEDEISPEEYETAFHIMYDLSKIMPYDIKSTEAPHYRRVVIQRRRKESGGHLNPGGVKNATDSIGRAPLGINDGKGFVFISHTGEVFPSGFLPISAGNVRQKSIVDIYRYSSLFRELRDYSRLKGKCGVCEFKHICGGSRARAFALTGDYMESEPYCVYVPKKYSG
ncbi:MAG: radical SAM protein [Deltaproteobacteria bacterium]|jgi:radical SAM protein|nr:MAG: radical SAM protein [Deltaproteobacteria bacterium]